MTRFETIGVNYQYDSRTVDEATKSFSISCDICCHKMRAMYCDCSHCAIRQTHEMIVANFNDNNKDEENK